MSEKLTRDWSVYRKSDQCLIRHFRMGSVHFRPPLREDTICLDTPCIPSRTATPLPQTCFTLLTSKSILVWEPHQIVIVKYPLLSEWNAFECTRKLRSWWQPVRGGWGEALHANGDVKVIALREGIPLSSCARPGAARPGRPADQLTGPAAAAGARNTTPTSLYALWTPTQILPAQLCKTLLRFN